MAKVCAEERKKERRKKERISINSMYLARIAKYNEKKMYKNKKVCQCIGIL
jgi:hypothetical protein